MKKSITNLFKVLFLGIMLLHVSSISNCQSDSTSQTRISFLHKGDQISGWFYKAQGTGPFSLIILLQGAVGKDGDILSLGRNLSKKGFNVMTFNYPGLWKSEGIRTDEGALGSVQSAINYAKYDSFLSRFNNDTSDIVLIGYSYGGGMALLSSALDESIKKVVAIAAGDLFILANKIEKEPAIREYYERTLNRILSDPAVARGTSGEEYVEALLENRDKYNLKQYSEILAKKKLLLIGGWLDNAKRIEDELLPLYRELLLKGADNIKIHAFETDHSFANQKEKLAETILFWLEEIK
jgi:pimeloyl-ACP methyl ester carboxylesterase